MKSTRSGKERELCNGYKAEKRGRRIVITSNIDSVFLFP